MIKNISEKACLLQHNSREQLTQLITNFSKLDVQFCPFKKQLKNEKHV